MTWSIGARRCAICILGCTPRILKRDSSQLSDSTKEGVGCYLETPGINP
ncbi:hypothetical protein SBC1_80360 (plasmid) [Caballeronia sp. SBC1]|nr:hypothetical protein SBC1_80360 [Caballeronia sp. SBC1]